MYLFVNIAVIPRAGYHWDETLDFSGEGWETYIANGRWGLALWKHIFGMGASPWTAGIFAGLLISATLILQLRILAIKESFQAIAFGAFTLFMPQFSRMLSYSIQSDAIAGGMLLCSLSVMMMIKSSGKKYINKLLSLLSGAALLAIAVGIYQTLALYFSILTLGYVLYHIKSIHLWRLILKYIVVLTISMLTYAIAKKISLSVIDIHAGILKQFEEGQESMLNNPILNPEGVMQIVMFTAHYAKLMLWNCFIPTYAGEEIYISTVVPVIGLLICSVMQKNGVKRKLLLWGVILLIWVAPFSMYIVLGNTWPCGPHTRLSEPLAMGMLWVAFLTKLHNTPSVKYIFAGLLLICGVRASNTVSTYAKIERAHFEKRLIARSIQIKEALEIAHQNHIPSDKLKILYLRSGSEKTNLYVDFGVAYPALSAAHSVQTPDYAKYKAELDSMPIWPAPGSIKCVENIVLIKGTDY